MKLDIAGSLYSAEKVGQDNLIDSLARSSGSDVALREQTDKFESIFIKALLDLSINSDNELYPKQPGSDIYASMFNEQLAESVSGGFGYSELLFNYLKDQGRS